MKEWWQNLNARERMVVGSGSVIAIAILFYLLVWSPLSNSVAAKKRYVNYQQNLVAWMVKAQAQLAHLQSSGIAVQKINSRDLLSKVDSSLKQHRLSPFMTSLSQTADNKVLVKFNGVPFDYFIQWVSFLWQRYAIKVEKISLKPDESIQGTVNIEIFLSLEQS